MPAKLLAVARRPDGLRDKQHVDQNIPTLKLYYLTSGRQRLHQTSTKYDQTQICHTLSIAAMGRNVVSVEPNMENVRHLHKAVNLGKLEHRITLLANALSSERGVSKIIYSRTNQGDTRMKQVAVLPNMDYGGDNYSSFIVLDDLVPFCKFKSAVIKIDIQGFEVNAFADADELFDTIHIPYIFMEWVLVRGFNPMTAPYEKSELFYRMMSFFKRRAYLPMDHTNTNPLSWANWKAWPYNIVWAKQSGKMHSGQPK